MRHKHGWRGWALAAGLALTLVAHAKLPTGAPDDAGIEAATQAIVGHAGTRRLILLGESHGTREIPDLVHALAAAYAPKGPVLLGLEIPHGEQLALDAYLRSDGGARHCAGARSGRSTTTSTTAAAAKTCSI